MSYVFWLMFWLFTTILGIWDGFRARQARHGKGPGISKKGYFTRMSYRMAFFIGLSLLAHYVQPFANSILIAKLTFLQMAAFWIVFEMIVHNIMFLPSLKGFIHIGSSAPLDRLIRAIAEAIGTAIFGKGREYVGIANIIAYGAKFSALYLAIKLYNHHFTWSFY